jgi:hypothetical protein
MPSPAVKRKPAGKKGDVWGVSNRSSRTTQGGRENQGGVVKWTVLSVYLISSKTLEVCMTIRTI